MAAIPTVTLWKDGAKLVVNEDRVPTLVKAGWSTDAPKGKEPAPPPAPEGAEKRQRRGTSKTGDLPIGE